MKVKHAKVSQIPDAGNQQLVQPSDWNAEHVIEDIQIVDIIGLQMALDGKINVGDVVEGTDGKSAYEVALDEGFVGTETQWLESLIGAAGASAYDVALDEGFVGSKQEWLDSLRGFALAAGDSNKMLQNDGNETYWAAITHTIDGFTESVEEALKTIVVDQGDL